MNIGIFAGTFDPIHAGHTTFIRSAIMQAKLEKVIVIAEKEPYHKKPHAPWDHRQAMIERATETIPEIDHDYQFASQLARQHTMNSMLEQAVLHYGEESAVWFLAGSDILEHVQRWHDLAQSEHWRGFVVAQRDEHTEEWLKTKLEEIQNRGIHVEVQLLPSTRPHVSSSEIRRAISKGEPISTTDPAVLKYAAEHELYTQE